MKNKISFLIMWAISGLFWGCAPKEETVLDPIPAMTWEELSVTPFLPIERWQTGARDWNVVNDSLRMNVDLPEALETRLSREDREVWRDAILHVEQSQAERKEAQILANFQMTPAESCSPPGSAFSLEQRSQLQLTLQLHRNVLWHLGRLEMASRGVSNALQSFLPMFQGGRISDADVSVVEPIQSMMQQIRDLRAEHGAVKGDWMPGALHVRAARSSHPEAVYVQAETILIEWSERMKASERWRYLGDSADPVIASLRVWREEFDGLIKAYRALSQNVRLLEREFSPPHSFVAWPCINHNLKQLRVVSELYGHILPIQWHLTLARSDAQRTVYRLRTADYDGTNREYLISLIEQFIGQINVQKVRLSRSEDLILVAMDELNEAFWAGLPDFVDPLHHHSHPAVESAQTWNLMYQEIVSELKSMPKPEAEPEQPAKKNGRRPPSYISKVIETLHAPSRIDEAERGLLAISELEAHMVSIRDELLKLCKQGACRSFPEAELAHSPRKSAWIVTWRQSPANERTLGHSLIVVKLCQLHLSRLVQRLTEIYAWFCETSNADLSWKRLDAWQRIWTLYAEPNGTYASFLRSIAALDQTISDMGKKQKKYAESEALEALLSLQDRFFDLTLDYARFIDGRSTPPISFDELIETWEMFDSRLVGIDEATQARDIAEHPELQKTKRKVLDIPR